MKVLILGGSQFVGRAAATEALSRGHEVTVLNRGKRPPVDGAAAIIGDRLSPDGMKGLEGKSFDAVVDTWAGDAVAVEMAANALRGRIGHFIYVSSLSVYLSSNQPPTTETSPVLDPETSTFKYGSDKLRGELAAEAAGAPVLIARPGLILGPHEGAKGRLPWWLNRMSRGGPTLAPGPSDMTLQFIDARDLAKFLIDGAESRLTGIFNTLSQPGHSSMGELLNTCNAVTGGNASLVWTETDKILAKGVKPWTELPIWMPGNEHDFCYNVDVGMAFAAGLRTRPAKETIADTWEWLQNTDRDSDLVTASTDNIGIDPEKELGVLQ
ncbi:hypothetical protein EDB81DRAFT_869888 [Dactylonectria macrodidyma]|uniref:NAD-dependent epimerase/dehydratase domain-containing protein n=1 Tax=Dactylonectria macrodidyma TaxID=307937 RepID=A0A9P9J4X2_9HYPO|nr:hypothetical protein EDB81DRAFT_869888 [Dactylonectria macrodidyma]